MKNKLLREPAQTKLYVKVGDEMKIPLEGRVDLSSNSLTEGMTELVEGVKIDYRLNILCKKAIPVNVSVSYIN